MLSEWLRARLADACPDLESSLHANPSDVAARPCEAGHNAKGNGVGHARNDWDRVCCRFETQNEAGGGCNDNIRLCAHHVAAELGIAVLSSLARISRHHQIFSLDIPKPAQLFEQRGIIWMVPGFVHFGDGDRGVNNCDAGCLRRLLRARHERPRGRRTAEQRG